MKFGFGVVALAAALAACGGESGSPSTPAPVIPVVPPAIIATRYQVEAGTALISRLDFYTTATIAANDPIFRMSFTSRQGVNFTGQTDRILPGASLAPDNDKPIFTLAAVGIDRASGIALGVRAPIGATVASPINSLIYATGDQQLVKRALQLTDGSFQLPGDVELRTESAVIDSASSDAAVRLLGGRLTASNIRVIALEALVYVWSAGPDRAPDIPLQLTPLSVDPIAAFLKANPATRLYTDAGTAALLKGLPQSDAKTAPYRDDVVAAAAHLINIYADAIGPGTADTPAAARYMLGIQGFLLPYLVELRQANTAAAAAAIQALTINDVYTATETFRAAPPPLSDNLFFPGPDFFRIAPGKSRTIPRDDQFGNGVNSFGFNDPYFANNNIGGAGTDVTVDSISVPASGSTALAAVLQPDQSIAITAKTGFSGVSYLDYVSRRSTGETATGRIYVIVR